MDVILLLYANDHSVSAIEILKIFSGGANDLFHNFEERDLRYHSNLSKDKFQVFKIESRNNSTDDLNVTPRKIQHWIKDLSNNKIDNVFQEIMNFAGQNNLELLHEFTVLASRWHKLKNDNTKGLLEDKEYLIGSNKIKDSLIRMVIGLYNL